MTSEVDVRLNFNHSSCTVSDDDITLTHYILCEIFDFIIWFIDDF